jgi:hypothetical protein
MSAPAANQSGTDRPVDVHALPAMFTALRLPSFLRHWQKLAERAVTVAAIDRLVHHAHILEMNVDSYRHRAAVNRRDHEAVAPATTSTDDLSKELSTD